MTARNDTLALMQRIGRLGVSLSFDQANTLRRAEITLHRWAELECGDANEYASWGIERDSETDKPYMCRYANNGKNNKWRIPDREAGALRRVRQVCKDAGLHFYHQTDPRGCALYVSNEPLPDNDYTRGIACCA
jgi:hypothetical protein